MFTTAVATFALTLLSGTRAAPSPERAASCTVTAYSQVAAGMRSLHHALFVVHD
jgi:hypothetical protein